ncbi:EAL domain-containing protein [Butyrivibrio sp. NC3005]|uniref:EAL domain-containing protein n=1 Tax=Butyrivibrio sp. NC3005 TaxID=1280685 RepID=UPI00040B5022|nr:EAL domain-containing protein [Butyrivibrio sp. NC3005]
MKSFKLTDIEYLKEHILNGLILMPGGFLIYRDSPEEEILYANQNLIELLDCKDEQEFMEFTHGSFGGVVAKEQIDSVRENIKIQIENNKNSFDHVSYNIRTRKGNIKFVEDYGKRIEDKLEGPIFCVFIAENTSSELIGDSDLLTGLSGMRRFNEKAQAILEKLKANNTDEEYCIIYYNLTNLKYLNVSQGIEAGNIILKNFSDILKNVFAIGYISRIAEDHFVVLTNTNELFEQLFEVHSRSLKLQNSNTVHVKAGVYYMNSTDISPAVDCDLAKFACDFIKKDPGKYFCEYKIGLEKIGELESYVIENLDEAISKRYLNVYYQPVIRTLTGKVCSLEALIRWDSPKRGTLPTSQVVTALEKYGLSHKLDTFVIKHVVKTIRKGIDSGAPIVPVSVNISRSDFESCDPVEMVIEIMKAFRVPHNFINIEITESALISDKNKMKKAIERFHENGFEIWMDDFGSGYSSLNILKDFDFDLIKIDMGFLRDMSEKSRTIVTATIKMAKQLGIHTLTEGVETEEQLDFMWNIGCERIQGYYYGKPEPIFDLIKHLYYSGLETEKPEDNAFYNKVGLTDLISERPIAIYFYDEKEVVRMYANEQYRKTIFFIQNSKEYASDNNKELAIEKIRKKIGVLAQKTVESNSAKSVVLPANGNDYRCSCELIASCNQGHMILVYMDQGLFKKEDEENVPDVFVDLPVPFVICRPVMNGNRDQVLDLEYVFVNQKYCEKTHKTAKELIGKTYLELFNGSNPLWIYYPYQAIITGKEVKARMFAETLKEWTEFSAIPSSIPGCCSIAFMGIDNDIEEKEELTRYWTTDDFSVHIAKILASDEPYEEAMNHILDDLGNEIGADRLFVLEISKNQIYGGFEWNREDVEEQNWIMEEDEAKDCLKCWSYYLKSDICIDIETIEQIKNLAPKYYGALKKRRVKRVLIVPFYSHGELIGYIGVDNYGLKKNLDTRRLMETVSYFIGASVSKHYFEHLSNYDELTKVNNRNAYIEKMRSMEAYKQGAGILVMDLNGLKDLNDNLGHTAGDQFLQDAANFISKFFGRENVYRTGGDEFAVIMPEIEREEFTRKGVEFREALKSDKAPNVSVGFSWCDKYEELKKALEDADEHMYKDKAAYYLNHDRRRKHVGENV